MPARYKRLRKALRKLGIRLVERAGKGSHVVLDDGKGHTYVLPLSHGEKTELSDVYVRALCCAFEIEYEEFVSLK